MNPPGWEYVAHDDEWRRENAKLFNCVRRWFKMDFIPEILLHVDEILCSSDARWLIQLRRQQLSHCCIEQYGASAAGDTPAKSGRRPGESDGQGAGFGYS